MRSMTIAGCRPASSVLTHEDGPAGLGLEPRDRSLKRDLLARQVRRGRVAHSCIVGRHLRRCDPTMNLKA